MRTLVTGLAIGALASVGCFAQSVISAHSGVIHYAEGTVLVNDKAYETKAGEFSEVKDNQVLKTEEGRAEVLLTPGVFLRLGENSSIRMVSNHLSDTRVEVLSGEALVECDELLKDNQVTILYKDASVAIAKAGLYRFDGTPGRLRVFDGEAVVTNPSGQLTAKKGHEVALNGGALMSSKFDTKAGDELMRWAARRSGYISMANVAAARSAGTSNYGSYYNGWAFNPYFGMFTFVPMSGIIYSPFGDPFWSPYAAFMYAPYYYPYGGYYGGYYGGGGVSTPTTAANSFHPTGRAGSNPYSGSRVAHTSPIGAGGGFGGRGGGFSAADAGGYSRGGYSGNPGYSGGGYSGGGGGVAMPSGGGAAVSSGGGRAAGGAGGGHR
jgi:hypothetical protein